jgi:hypothetical protein
MRRGWILIAFPVAARFRKFPAISPGPQAGERIDDHTAPIINA